MGHRKPSWLSGEVHVEDKAWAKRVVTVGCPSYCLLKANNSRPVVSGMIVLVCVLARNEGTGMKIEMEPKAGIRMSEGRKVAAVADVGAEGAKAEGPGLPPTVLALSLCGKDKGWECGFGSLAFPLCSELLLRESKQTSGLTFSEPCHPRHARGKKRDTDSPEPSQPALFFRVSQNSGPWSPSAHLPIVKAPLEPRMMAHACKPSTLETGKGECHKFKASVVY